ncbi:GGDEF domain-containing protein [Ectopseudomonas toyotomiensis]|uniref:diguanylate cyclase n=1 Tax=Ectopseudomonas toyotomiensis TaxID=554344 RepID=A0A1I5TCQ5_9GAMM|nr:GGDEF domain-containing protein [Pseudomonas toyotomiensis]PIA73961.1 GGDEF domain-containing protein [Pseudomonas toyotomiensis]SFP80800.1 diguanylate cyclase [Pseudomonas toyotomiensis]
MSDDAQRWKDKYLSSLEQQEKLDRRWESRLDLLRRGLVRSSLAAEGADKAVDQCMQEMREILRRDDMDSALGGLIPRLEKAVLDSEQRRQQRAGEAAAALAALIEQLQRLQPPREVRKALKSLGKQLEDATTHQYLLPALLSQLSNLQGQALTVLQAPVQEQPGLLQRLFGSRGETSESNAQVPGIVTEATGVAEEPAAELTPTPTPTPTAVAVANEPPPSVSNVASVPARHQVQDVSPMLDSLPLPPGLVRQEQAGDSPFSLPSSEPGYSAVAPHIASSLRNLLDELELPARHLPQGEALRLRLEGNLNWYELVPVLDDLAVLVLAVTDSGQREFAGYLKQLNERLAAFIETLSEAHEGYSASVENARSFNQQLRDQVSDLQNSVQEAADLESLKQALEQRLEGLLQSVSSHQRQRDSGSDDVAERLQGLVKRVAEMEQEAQQFREHIEEQRQKSLLDPLTGLPNRAAWSERLDLEVARRQRYGGQLLLAVLDVDHFKRINDGYGHLAGDRVLKIIAGELSKRLRKTDFIARFGGEEFVLLIPATPLEGGVQLLETLRAAIEACPFHFKGEPVTITFSAGIAEFRNGEATEVTFERADQALYRAKGAGRNRVEQAA